MNPHRKFKNHSCGGTAVGVLVFVAMIAFLPICILVLNPIHKQNIEQIRSKPYITSPWISEPKGQEYNLQHGDWVFFWKSDEKPVRVGMVYVLWGYYRIIAHKNGMTEFRDVEWCNANF